MRRLPTEIDIIGQRFRVEVVDHPTAALDATDPESHDALGHCDRTAQVIRIRGAGVLSDSKARETLLHETLHAIIGTARIHPFMADDDAEETWVSQLSPLLLYVLRSNPRFVAALISRRSSA